jgi:hypothetical protein
MSQLSNIKEVDKIKEAKNSMWTPKGFKCGHVRAMLVKNGIYWKRGYVMSFLEVALPILLMASLVVARVMIKRQVLPAQGFTYKINIENEELINATLMQYPFLDNPENLPIGAVLAKEANFTRFFEIESPMRFSYLPRACVRHSVKRMIIALWPKDDYT